MTDLNPTPDPPLFAWADCFAFLSVRKKGPGLLIQVLLTVGLVQSVLAAPSVLLTTVYSFTGGNDGFRPSGLVLGDDGDFYGTTIGGGSNQSVTVFRITPSGSFTILYSFANSGSQGPGCPLTLSSDGWFYGTTPEGGSNFSGVVFKVATNGAFSNLFEFPFQGNGSSTYDPYAGLAQGNDGDFYGSTLNGGTNGDGTIYKITPTGTLTILYSFNGETDGGRPESTLMLASDGNFYGTTQDGTTNGYAGTVFKFTTNGVLTSLHFFTAGADGAFPNGLAQGNDGAFYGTTREGGYGFGTVFKITTNGLFTALHTFSPMEGETPVSTLVQGIDGYFYGTAFGGGASNSGTLFRIDTNGVFTSLYSFTGASDGSAPNGVLVQGPDGNFYGEASAGGPYESYPDGFGTLFRLIVGPDFLRALATNGVLDLTWSAQRGRTYQLQFNSDLGSTNWNSLGGPVVAANSALDTFDSITNAAYRFYRLQLLY